MTYSVDIAALPEWLAAETQPNGAAIAVLAGHFAIFSAGGAADDLLDGTESPPHGAAEMLDFTRLSWCVACDVARDHPDHAFRMVALVDDIQFVRPAVQNRALAERLAAALAGNYLDRVRQLPPYHARELGARSLGPERILHRSAARWLFSERELRSAAVRHLRQRFADDGGRTGLTSSDNGSTMTVTLPEQGSYCLVHSGHTTCAGGYVELLSTLHQRGIRKLIAFVPMRCFGQVALGTQLAQHLFELPGFDVVTLAIPDPGGRVAAVVDRSSRTSADAVAPRDRHVPSRSAMEPRRD